MLGARPGSLPHLKRLPLLQPACPSISLHPPPLAQVALIVDPQRPTRTRTSPGPLVVPLLRPRVRAPLRGLLLLRLLLHRSRPSQGLPRLRRCLTRPLSSPAPPRCPPHGPLPHLWRTRRGRTAFAFWGLRRRATEVSAAVPLQPANSHSPPQLPPQTTLCPSLPPPALLRAPLLPLRARRGRRWRGTPTGAPRWHRRAAPTWW